jgi:glycerophosphoryl diester phosphodiesterase
LRTFKNKLRGKSNSLNLAFPRNLGIYARRVLRLQNNTLEILPQIIAHRGASAYAPENTLAAFAKALDLGCRYVECDVMLSADGEPFVFHDEKLKRTTNGKGKLGQVNTAYLQSLDAGRWFARRYRGEKILHLRELLQWLVGANVQANIEIKPFPGTVEQTASVVLAHIQRYWPPNKSLPLISSFELDALKLCRSLAPELPLGLLLDKWNNNWQQTAEDLQCYSVHCNQSILSATRAKQIKQQDFKLLAYTVNHRRIAKKLFAWGVDAVFSDYPNLLTMRGYPFAKLLSY